MNIHLSMPLDGPLARTRSINHVSPIYSADTLFRELWRRQKPLPGISQ